MRRSRWTTGAWLWTRGVPSEAKLAFEQATLRAESDNELRYWAKLSLGHVARSSPALRDGVAITKADSGNAG